MKNIVFFSGGSALASTARELARRKREATYLITTFDSGGSTQALRKAFDMPAIGDLRNRLLATADIKQVGEKTLAFLEKRISNKVDHCRARELLRDLIDKQAWQELYEGAEIGEDLAFFLLKMPGNFEAANASLGNLALAGAYLRLERDLDQALDKYKRLLNVIGQIIPVVEDSYHLCGELIEGGLLVGQHVINKHLPSPLKRIFLTKRLPWGEGSIEEARPQVNRAALAAIDKADLICFSMGSFYSSILCNLLPKDVGSAIYASKAVKVFVPNTGCDPELKGLDLPGQVKQITKVLEENCKRTGKFIDYIAIDSCNGDYPGGLTLQKIESLKALGIEIIDAPIVAAPCCHDPGALLDCLDELA